MRCSVCGHTGCPAHALLARVRVARLARRLPSRLHRPHRQCVAVSLRPHGEGEGPLAGSVALRRRQARCIEQLNSSAPPELIGTGRLTFDGTCGCAHAGRLPWRRPDTCGLAAARSA